MITSKSSGIKSFTAKHLYEYFIKETTKVQNKLERITLAQIIFSFSTSINSGGENLNL